MRRASEADCGQAPYPKMPSGPSACTTGGAPGGGERHLARRLGVDADAYTGAEFAAMYPVMDTKGTRVPAWR